MIQHKTLDGLSFTIIGRKTSHNHDGENDKQMLSAAHPYIKCLLFGDHINGVMPLALFRYILLSYAKNLTSSTYKIIVSRH
jgi:hypothetical protein